MNSFEWTMHTQLISNVLHLAIVAGTAVFFVYKFAYRFYRSRKLSKQIHDDINEVSEEPTYKRPDLQVKEFSNPESLAAYINSHVDTSVVSITVHSNTFTVFFYSHNWKDQ